MAQAITAKRAEPAGQARHLLWRFGGWGGSLLLIALLMTACAGSTSGPGGAHSGDGATATPPRATATGMATQTVPASVWATLASKPLQLPVVAPGATCPVTAAQQHISPDYATTIGAGPVYIAAAQGSAQALAFVDAASQGDASSGWGGAKVYWQIAPAYTGPVLIRGKQLDGTHAVRFNGGLGQGHSNPEGTEPILDELHLTGGGATAPSWPTWITFTRLQAPGCYAYQVDGLSFSEVIVFQAVAQ